MNDEQARFERLMDLYNDALELDETARAAFLDAHCNGDAALRTEVETLLAQAGTSLPTRPPLDSLVAQMAAELGQDFTGTKLGHYEMRARIGAGGMGVVWRAWDDTLNREVAIKILPAELAADSGYLARFQHEARAASTLHHPNIITIYEVGQAPTPRGTLPFIVTEFIEGQTLRDYLAQPHTKRSWRAAIPLATQTVSALAAAHAADLIHRDIKPENIMVQNGQVKVLDFGIAKMIGQDEGGGGTRDEGGGMRDESEKGTPIHPSSLIPHPSTIPGARLGTIRYMSPEQARGEVLDARTDIFSFGVVLYEMLTGQRPYGQAEGDEMLRQLMDAEEIAPVSQQVPNLPAALDRIVTRALRKNREERYATASEMLNDLKELRINREEKGLRRLRTQSANQMLTQFVVRYDEDKTTRITLGGLWTIGRFADLPRGKLEREVLRKSRWSVFRRLGGLALVIAVVTLALAALASRTETWEEKVLRDGHTAAVRRAVFSPDGTKLVSVGEDKQVIVWDFEKRERLATFTDHTDWVAAVAFSPDGTEVVSAGDDKTIALWDVAGQRRIMNIGLHTSPVYAVAFSPDGRQIISGAHDHSVRLYTRRSSLWGWSLD
jgi:serine/threonine protein kinase